MTPDDPRSLSPDPRSLSLSKGPAATVLALLRERGQTLATAESLTGGLIGARLTDVPGASASYVGGVVVYATRLKAELAGVPADLLDRVGPVDAATASAMATGVAASCGADWGLAVTGVAGPDPQDGHPVGQVFLGLSGPDPDGVQVRELRLTGDRQAIRQQCVDAALAWLAEALDPASGTSATAAVVHPQ